MDPGRYGGQPLPNYPAGYPVYIAAPHQPHFQQHPQHGAPLYPNGIPVYNQNAQYYARPPPNYQGQHQGQHQGPHLPVQGEASLQYRQDHGPVNQPFTATPPVLYTHGGPPRRSPSPSSYPWSSAITPPSPGSFSFAGKNISPAPAFNQPLTHPVRPATLPGAPYPAVSKPKPGAFPGSLLDPIFVKAAGQHSIHIQVPAEKQSSHPLTTGQPAQSETAQDQCFTASGKDASETKPPTGWSKGFERLNQPFQTGFQTVFQKRVFPQREDALHIDISSAIEQSLKKKSLVKSKIKRKIKSPANKEVYEKKIKENCFWIPEDSEESIDIDESLEENSVPQTLTTVADVSEIDGNNLEELEELVSDNDIDTDIVGQDSGQFINTLVSDDDIDIVEHEYLDYCDELSFTDDSCDQMLDEEDKSINSVCKVGETNKIEDIIYENTNNNERTDSLQIKKVDDTVLKNEVNKTEGPESKKLLTKEQIINHCFTEIKEAEVLKTDLLTNKVTTDKDIEMLALILAKEAIAKGVVKFAKSLNDEVLTDDTDSEVAEHEGRDMLEDPDNTTMSKLRKRLYSWTYLEDRKEEKIGGLQDQKEKSNDEDAKGAECTDNGEEKILQKPREYADELPDDKVVKTEPSNISNGEPIDKKVEVKPIMNGGIHEQNKLNGVNGDMTKRTVEKPMKEMFIKPSLKTSEDFEKVYFKKKASQHGIIIKSPSDGQAKVNATESDFKTCSAGSEPFSKNSLQQVDYGGYEPRRPINLRAQSEDSDSDTSFRNRRLSGTKLSHDKYRRSRSEDVDSDATSLEGSQSDAVEAFRYKASLCGIRIQDPKDMESPADSEIEFSERNSRSNSIDRGRRETSTPDSLNPNLNPDSPMFRPSRSVQESLDWVIPDSSQPSSADTSGYLNTSATELTDKNSRRMRADAPEFTPVREPKKMNITARAFQPKMEDGNNNNNAKPVICYTMTPKKPPSRPAVGIQASPLMAESCVGTRRVKYKDTGTATGTCDSREVSVNTDESCVEDLNLKVITPRPKFVSKGVNTLMTKKRTVGLNVNIISKDDSQARKLESMKSSKTVGESKSKEMSLLTEKVKNLQVELMKYKQREVVGQLQDTLQNIGPPLATMLNICTTREERTMLEKMVQGKQEHLTKLIQHVQHVTQTTIAQINAGWVLNELPDLRSLRRPSLWSPVKPMTSHPSVPTYQSPDPTELQVSPDLNCSNNALSRSAVWSGETGASPHALSPKMLSAHPQKTSQVIRRMVTAHRKAVSVSVHDSLIEMQTLKSDQNLTTGQTLSSDQAIKSDQGVVDASPSNKNDTPNIKTKKRSVLDMDDSDEWEDAEPQLETDHASQLETDLASGDHSTQSADKTNLEEFQAVTYDMQKLIADKMNDEYWKPDITIYASPEVEKAESSDKGNSLTSIAKMYSIDSDEDDVLDKPVSGNVESSEKENQAPKEVKVLDAIVGEDADSHFETTAAKCKSESVDISDEKMTEASVDEIETVNDKLETVKEKVHEKLETVKSEVHEKLESVMENAHVSEEEHGMVRNEEVPENEPTVDKEIPRNFPRRRIVLMEEDSEDEPTTTLNEEDSDDEPTVTQEINGNSQLSPNFLKEVFMSPESNAQSVLPNPSPESNVQSLLLGPDVETAKDSKMAVMEVSPSHMMPAFPATVQVDTFTSLAAGGMEPMAGGMVSMAGGMVSMASGMEPMASGMVSMAGGMATMTGGMATMAGGMATMTGDMATMAGGMATMAGGVDPMLYQAVMTQLLQAYPEMAVNHQLLMSVALQQTLLLQQYISCGSAGNTEMVGSSAAGMDYSSLMGVTENTNSDSAELQVPLTVDNNLVTSSTTGKETDESSVQDIKKHSTISDESVENDSQDVLDVPDLSRKSSSPNCTQSASSQTAAESPTKSKSSRPPGLHSLEDAFGFNSDDTELPETVEDIPPSASQNASQFRAKSDHSDISDSQKDRFTTSPPVKPAPKCESPPLDFLPDFAHRHNPVNSSTRVIHSFVKKLDEQVMRSLSNSDTVNFERKTPSPPPKPVETKPPDLTKPEAPKPDNKMQQDFPALGKPDSRLFNSATTMPLVYGSKPQTGTTPQQMYYSKPQTGSYSQQLNNSTKQTGSVPQQLNYSKPQTGSFAQQLNYSNPQTDSFPQPVNTSRPQTGSGSQVNSAWPRTSSYAPEQVTSRFVPPRASHPPIKASASYPPQNLPPRLRSDSFNVSPTENWDDEVDPYPTTYTMGMKTRTSPQIQLAGDGYSRPEVETTRPPMRLPVGLPVVDHGGNSKQRRNAAMCDIPVPVPKQPAPDGKKDGQKTAEEIKEQEDWCKVKRKRHGSKEQTSEVRTMTSPYANPGLTAAQKKSKVSNFDRLVARMILEFPYADRQQIIDAITNIRCVRGSLSGLSMESIIEKAHSFIKTNNPPQQKTIPGLPPQAQRSSQQPNLAQRLQAKLSSATVANTMTSAPVANTMPSAPVANTMPSASVANSTMPSAPVTNGMPRAPVKQVWQESSFTPEPTPDDADEEICVICHDPLSSEPVKKLDCFHSFHTKCISQWVERERTCPTCRQLALFPEDFPRLGS